MNAATSAEEYRRRAMAILEWAERLPIGIERTRLLKVASQWARLAQFKDNQVLD